MANIYRVRYKKGDVELDIESSDKEYVDRKLAEFWKPGEEQQTERAGLSRKDALNGTGEPDGSNLGAKVPDCVLVTLIARINEAENYEDIAKNILDKTDRTARILLCYYFARKHPMDPALTSTHVERITEHLGMKIASPNVAKVIREGAGKYLTADRVRKKGIAVHYKINRRGIAIFEKIARGERP
jgi:hypothetical protein